MGAFIKWLQEELKIRGWSQAELSRRSHLSKSGISYLFTGGRQPGPVTVRAIANALNLPEDEVFEKAGLLSETSTESDATAELLHLFAQLPQHDQEEIIEFIRLKIKLIRR